MVTRFIALSQSLTVKLNVLYLGNSRCAVAEGSAAPQIRRPLVGLEKPFAIRIQRVTEV